MLGLGLVGLESERFKFNNKLITADYVGINWNVMIIMNYLL